VFFATQKIIFCLSLYEITKVFACKVLHAASMHIIDPNSNAPLKLFSSKSDSKKAFAHTLCWFRAELPKKFTSLK
jgi:hypothetical protein